MTTEAKRSAFHDLGLPDADELVAKSRLMRFVVMVQPLPRSTPADTRVLPSAPG